MSLNIKMVEKVACIGYLIAAEILSGLIGYGLNVENPLLGISIALLIGMFVNSLLLLVLVLFYAMIKDILSD